MRFTRRMVVVIVTMIVFSSVSIFLPIDFENVARGSPSEEYKVNLNFHESEGNNYMNSSIPGENTTRSFLTGINFILNPAIKEDLSALSIEEGIGFELHFYYASGATEVFVNVTHNDDTIANSSKTLDGTQGTWANVDIAWNEERDSYDFSKGDTFNVDISFTGTVYFSYNTTDDQGRASRLTLKCKQINEISVETYRMDPVSKLHVKTDEYQPNMHENYSFIIVKGEIRDAFGEYDIGHIDVIVKDYDEEQINGGEISAVIEPGYPINYTFEWNYSGKIYDYSQKYNITVNVSDVQNNVFEKSKQFAITKYGVFIEKPSERNIGLGLQITIPVEVWNTGVGTDKITLATDDPGGGWEITLSKSVINNLGAGEMTIINADVIAPDNAVIGTTKIINIIGQTGGEGSEIKKYEMGLRLTIADVFDVDLYMENDNGQRVSEIDFSAEVGVRSKYTIYIHNIGTAKDNVKLELEGLPNDWEAEWLGLYNDSITIEADVIADVMIEIEPAQSENAEDIANLLITGTSQNDDTKSDDVSIKITRTFGVLLQPDSTNKTTTTGSPATFFVNVENTGQEERTYILDYNAPDNWVTTVSPESVTLEGGGKIKVTLRTTPPTDASFKESGYKITLTATDQNEPLKSQTIELYVNIDVEYGVEITCKIFKLKVEKEEKAEYYIDILSKSNAKTDIKLEIERIPKDWDAKLDETIIKIDPDQKIQVKLTVIPSGDTSVDDEARIRVIATVLDSEGNPKGGKKECETITTVKGDFLTKLEDAVGNLWIVFVLLFVVVVVAITLSTTSGEEDWEDTEDDFEDEENEGEEEKDEEEDEENKEDGEENKEEDGKEDKSTKKSSEKKDV